MRHDTVMAGGAEDSSALWYATAAAAPHFEQVQAELETDVLIIGGGVAGLSTALHLAEAGIDVVVIEAGQPGSGATGQSGGLIAPDYIRHSPETIGRVLGRQNGERLTRFLGESAQFCFDLIDRHAIDCDARQDGFSSPAHTPALANMQRSYAMQWASRGHNVRFMEAEDVRRTLGSRRYCGALHFADGGSLNPLAYARGLARAAAKAGAAIFTESPVSILTRLNDGWHAQAAGGGVRARRLVLAANGGNAALHPALRRTALPLHVVEFATVPLSLEQRTRLLPESGSFTDKTPYVFSARYDGPGHMISAFPVSFLVRGQKGWHKEARRRLISHFPAMGKPSIDYLWEGTAWINPSLLPELYDLGDNAFAIQACNGRGLSINSSLGRDMAAALASGDHGHLPVLLRAPSPIRMHAIASLLPKTVMTMAYISNRLFSLSRAARDSYAGDRAGR